MRQHALPSPSRFTKTSVARSCVLNSCPMNLPFVRVSPSNHRAVSVNADPKIVRTPSCRGVKAPDLMTSKKTRPVNYFSVRANNDPVICDKSSNTFEIVS